MRDLHLQIDSAAPLGVMICRVAVVLLVAGCCGIPSARVVTDDTRLETIGTRMVKSAWGNGELKLMVEDSIEENAYCDVDGTIVVCRGMMELCESEDELAAIVAHEMGHLVAKHKGSATPEKEIEADEIGLSLMVKAGNDPCASGRFWRRYYERINWWEGDGTHELPKERVERLEKEGAAMMELKRAASQKTEFAN